MSLLEKALKKIDESKNIGNNIKEEKIVSKSSFVGRKLKQNYEFRLQEQDIKRNFYFLLFLFQFFSSRANLSAK